MKRFKKLGLGLFGFLFTATLFGLSSPVANAWSAEYGYIDGAHWELRSLTFTEEDVESELLDRDYISRIGGGDIANGVRILNNTVASQVAGQFADSNSMDSTIEYVRNTNNCGDSSKYRFQEGEFKITNIIVSISGEGCDDVIRRDLVPAQSIEERSIANVQFRYENENTIVRVDGRDGAFVLSDPENYPDRFFRVDEQGEGDQDYVTLIVNQNGVHVAQYVVDGDSRGQYGITGLDNRDQPPTEVNADGTVGDTDSEEEQEDNTCEGKSGAMGWILCPVIDLVDGALNWVDQQIQRLLEVDRNKYTNQELKTAWTTIRNIAFIILVPIMLVMVIGTALNMDIFSAYTVKKALPRMVIAIIFITLSWYICVFLIDFFNAVGGGILHLLTSPFTEQMPASCQDGGMNLACLFEVQNGVNGGSVLRAIMAPFLLVGSAIGLIVFLLFFGGTLLLAIGAGFLVLLARQLFILALTLVAPLAILAWIFPGNDKLWKGWWGAFSKLLMMYPLIMVLIAVGRIFAWLLNETGGGALDGAIINPVLKFLAYLIPYAFIPLTFKFAGGIFANLAGFVNDKEKGLFDRARNKRAERWERGKGGNLFKGASERKWDPRRRANSMFERGANISKAGATPWKMKSRQNAALSQSAYNEALEARDKNEHFKAISGNDDYLEAGMHSTDENKIKNFLAERGYDAEGQREGAALIRAAQRSMSDKGFNIAAAVSNAATGTGYGSGAGEMYAAINKAAGGDRAVANRMLADARGLADRARRPDLVASGFGEASRIMQSVHTGDMTAEQATQHQDLRALNTQDPRALLGAKPKIVQRLAPQIVEKFSNAMRADNFNEDQALDAGAQMAVLRNQLGYYPEEVRQEIVKQLDAVGVDVSASASVDQQVGAMIATRKTGVVQDDLTTPEVTNVANEVRTRAGLFEQGDPRYKQQRDQDQQDFLNQQNQR